MFFLWSAGVQTNECPSTYWAHAFEFGENIRLFTKAPINEANFYYFTCLKWVSDHKLTCNRPRAMCLGSLNRIQQSALSIDSLSCCCIAVSHDTCFLLVVNPQKNVVLFWLKCTFCYPQTLSSLMKSISSKSINLVFKFF